MIADIDRLANKFVVDDGCWEWTAAKDLDGYGVVIWREKQRHAHRAVYELLVADIAPGLHLDHLCRNRGCVNPGHMEPVTPRENTLRGLTLPALNAAKTHCPQGHAYDEANTYVNPTTRRRHCRTCTSRAGRQLSKARSVAI